MKKLKVNAIIHPQFKNQQQELTNIIQAYDALTTYIAKGTRNTIKLATLSDGTQIAIKSFKRPNFINRYAYTFLRKPKGLRSYEHADQLDQLGIKTPKGIAYFEYSSNGALKDSYYISEYIQADITYRDIDEHQDCPQRELVLQKFVEFTFKLHQKGINFLDHSPGNTLIKAKDNSEFDFYLVDINRMKFNQEMSFSNRMKNLSHLTTNIHDIEKMATHYALLIGKSSRDVFIKLWLETIKFQYRFYKKKAIKNKVKKMYYQ
ncbi:Kdo domain containing protein [Myroides marinus]|uniref:lipopolysaccharide kinase InaA family protein n=1 Tax=Myroides marinus TaxID=703342 RepID=UPI002574E594|nr:lipopolysaccharide kinase InaA family protein [Myroides marinus]MDM1347210.1 Kdo domain containing protein [Myroides marinus]MDM1350488.1 Kdo domain containing protein [Myroides marinus]MDM1355047.1 Kdo domain containing protein [Myroides marinus]MDM1357777.1 Kdo domain containing protein [Myroides marinus]MDM1365130.1 Kdo domain containing protein [Myroides marinus]